MAHTEPPPQNSIAAGHETSDASLGSVEKYIVGMAVFLAVTFLITAFIYMQFKSREASVDTPPPAISGRAGQGDRIPPMPRLQTLPTLDLRGLRSNETQVLDSYAWEDKPRGVVRIPIARAMELIAERGLPERPPAPPAAAAPAGAAPAPAAPAAATAKH